MKPLSIFVVLGLAIAAFVLVEWRPWQGIESATTQVAGKVQTSTEAASLHGNGVALQNQNSMTNGQTSSSVISNNSQHNPQINLTNSATATRGLSEQLIKAQLTPANYTTLVAETSGRVSLIGFKEGEPFGQGAVLVEFDCELQKAQLERVTAEMAIARRNSDANVRLLARGAVSQLEADNAKSELDRAQALARELEVLVSKCTVLAPYDGKVGERFVRAEQFVQAGEPLMDILDDSAMELEFIVPSTWIAWLNQGYAFEIEMEETQKTYPAVVSRISARIDPISRTVKVVGVIDGQFVELKPGMSGSIKVKAPEQVQQARRVQ